MADKRTTRKHDRIKRGVKSAAARRLRPVRPAGRQPHFFRALHLKGGNTRKCSSETTTAATAADAAAEAGLIGGGSSSCSYSAAAEALAEAAANAKAAASIAAKSSFYLSYLAASAAVKTPAASNCNGSG